MQKPFCDDKSCACRCGEHKRAKCNVVSCDCVCHQFDRVPVKTLVTWCQELCSRFPSEGMTSHQAIFHECTKHKTLASAKLTRYCLQQQWNRVTNNISLIQVHHFLFSNIPDFPEHRMKNKAELYDALIQKADDPMAILLKLGKLAPTMYVTTTHATSGKAKKSAIGKERKASKANKKEHKASKKVEKKTKKPDKKKPQRKPKSEDRKKPNKPKANTTCKRKQMAA